jgi:hypothetical protein
MSTEQVVSAGLAVASLTGLGVATGAAIMWRLVHVKANPPPLPAWVHGVELASVSLFGLAAWIVDQWLLVASMGLLVLLGIVQLAASLRARAPGS